MHTWYKNYIGNHIFRKINLLIGISLFVVFLIVGTIIFLRGSSVIEERERQLLQIQTEKFADELETAIEQFKQEVITLYNDQTVIDGQVSKAYQLLLPLNVPKENERYIELLQNNYFRNKIKTMANKFEFLQSIYFYRTEDEKIFHDFTLNNATEANINHIIHSLPKTYNSPIFGIHDKQSSNEAHVLYFANPIYNFDKIIDREVYGYIVATINQKAFEQAFSSNLDNDSFVTVSVNDQYWYDEQIDINKNKLITYKTNLDQYGLEIIGSKDMTTTEAEISSILFLIIFIFSAALLILIFVITKIQKAIKRKINRLSTQFKHVQQDPFVNTLYIEDDDEISQLMKQFNEMTLTLQDHINREYIAEFQKKNAEYFALKMQINPHFLYNTLESLRMQALIKNEKELSDKIFTLGQLFRWILRSEYEEIPIDEELRYTNYYLDLFMIGQDKKITLEYEPHDEMSEIYILKFSLQPIIENALLHGNLITVDRPTIRISIEIIDEQQIIRIFNNGEGISTKKYAEIERRLNETNNHSEHVGLRNIHKRIQAYYGEAYGISLVPSPPDEGFMIEMNLPIIKNR